MRILATAVLVIGIQLLGYVLVVRRAILTWGTTGDEPGMPLPGDDSAQRVASTRAITIGAPVSEVWQWVIQLGADRGGFFSYALLEKALGYRSLGTGTVPEFQDFDVGRVIPASVDGARKVAEYNFPVVAVEPGESFVLENWGAFTLTELGPGRTRLIVRTHGWQLSGPRDRFAAFVMEPLHYLMERRMLLGFKARAEAGRGVRLSSVPDNLWLTGVFLSGIGVAALVLLGAGIPGGVLSVALGLGWLLVLLILPPRPAYGVGFLLLVSAALAWAT